MQVFVIARPKSGGAPLGVTESAARDDVEVQVGLQRIMQCTTCSMHELAMCITRLCLDGDGISRSCRWLCLMRESASSFQTPIMSIWHAPSPFRILSHPIALGRSLAVGSACKALRVGVDLVRVWLAVRPSRCSSGSGSGSARAVKYLPMMRG
jgi:hypothetical protein